MFVILRVLSILIEVKTFIISILDEIISNTEDFVV